jgi:hypothetical protein
VAVVDLLEEDKLCSCCYVVSQHLILDLLHVLHYVNVLMYYVYHVYHVYHIMCYVTRVTRRSRGRELGQEGMCNRVCDRYEDEVAHTLAHATRSSRCGRHLCKRDERSNM